MTVHATQPSDSQATSFVVSRQSCQGDSLEANAINRRYCSGKPLDNFAPAPLSKVNAISRRYYSENPLDGFAIAPLANASAIGK